jgi:competence ComEA-like helix-hairpin-helix protein
MIILSRLIVILSLLFLFTPVVFATEKIDINTASLEQLDKIIGIGPVLAQRIIETRPFYSVDDLIKVEGIGEKTLQKIKDQGLV